MDLWTPQQRESIERVGCQACLTLGIVAQFCDHSDLEFHGRAPIPERAHPTRVLPAGPCSPHTEPAGSFQASHHPSHNTAQTLGSVRAGGEIINHGEQHG